MLFKWVLIIATSLSLLACSNAEKRPSLSEVKKPETVNGPVPPSTPPSIDHPSQDKPKIRESEAAWTRADTVENTVQLDEKKSLLPAAIIPNPEMNIYFPAGGTQVDETAKALLHRHADRLKRNPNLVINLIGHTDPLGSRSYNLALAEERMDSVFQVLRSLGVPKGQIRRVSSGRGTVDAACKSAACRRLMRRVELVISE